MVPAFAIVDRAIEADLWSKVRTVDALDEQCKVKVKVQLKHERAQS